MPQGRQRGLVSRSSWIAGIFLAFGLLDATQTVIVMRAEGMHHPWATLFLFRFLTWIPWALATPLAVKLGFATGKTPFSAGLIWLGHVAQCGLLLLVAAAWDAGLLKRLNPYAYNGTPLPFSGVWFDDVTNHILAALILYGCILLLAYLLESQERLSRQQMETAQLNEQLSRAQLSALRRQIEPHFLFNTLNGIAGLIREGNNDVAVSMIAALSDFLRRVIDDDQRQEVPLSEEIEFLEKYLDIEKMRFGSRLQVTIDMPCALNAARVPRLILQPMVENAVKHGIGKRAAGGEIRICATHAEGMLNLRVYNDGPRLPVPELPETSGSGVGLANVRSRLRALYADSFALTMSNHDPDGVEVLISIPFIEG